MPGRLRCMIALKMKAAWKGSLATITPSKLKEDEMWLSRGIQTGKNTVEEHREDADEDVVSHVLSGESSVSVLGESGEMEIHFKIPSTPPSSF